MSTSSYDFEVTVRSADAWDHDYGSGRWDYLWGGEQAGRYRLVAGACCRRDEPRRVLDIGCGEGVLLNYLFPFVDQYAGVDLSHLAIERASTRYKDHRNATFSLSSGEELSVTPGHFSSVVFNEVLYYCADPLGLLERYRAALAPGGTFVISVTLPLQPLWNALAKHYERHLVEHWRLDDQHSQKAWFVGVIAPDVGGAHAWKA